MPARRDGGQKVRVGNETNKRDAVRVRQQWTSDKNAAARANSYRIVFRGRPREAGRLASAGKDPAAGLVDRIGAAALSEEGVWAWRRRPASLARRPRLRGRTRDMVSELDALARSKIGRAAEMIPRPGERDGGAGRRTGL